MWWLWQPPPPSPSSVFSSPEMTREAEAAFFSVETSINVSTSATSVRGRVRRLVPVFQDAQSFGETIFGARGRQGSDRGGLYFVHLLTGLPMPRSAGPSGNCKAGLRGAPGRSAGPPAMERPGPPGVPCSARWHLGRHPTRPRSSTSQGWWAPSGFVQQFAAGTTAPEARGCERNRSRCSVQRALQGHSHRDGTMSPSEAEGLEDPAVCVIV